MHTLLSRSVVLHTALFVATLGSSLGAQEWTRFRGPNGTGASEATTVPAKWTMKDFNWRIKLPGYGNSSPVLWGETVFVLSANPDNATRIVSAINAKTGDVLWEKKFASQTHRLHSRATYASSTPAVDDERVYCAWATPDKATLIAFTHKGDIAWEKDLGPWTGWHGFGTSPIVYDGMVILHNSQQVNQLEPSQRPGKSHMMAFEAGSGDEIWSTPLVTTRVSYSVPCIYQPEKGGAPELVCTSTGDGFFSLDPSTGEENWKVDAFAMRTVASPIICGGHIFGSTGSGQYSSNYVAALKLDGKEPTLAYKLANSRTFKAPYVPGFVAKDDLVFTVYDRGFAGCVHAPSGEVVWHERVRGSFSGSAVRVGNRIYCMEESGEMVVLAAEKEFKLLARNPLGESGKSTPAVANGAMFIRTDTHLMSVGG